MQVNIDVPKTDIRVLALKGDKGDTGSGGFSPTASVSKSGDTATISITDQTGTTTANITDGFSPSASVSKIGDTATISITDKNGTTTAAVTDGTNGTDGFSPTATVSKSGGTATISITDKNGTTTATVTDGTNGTNGTDGFSPTATVTKSGSTVTISITDKNGTTTSTITEPASSYTYQKSVTLFSSSWTSSGGIYYYQISDNSITTSDQVNGFLDLTNQALLKDGYIETFAGYYRIYTSEQPTSNITITLTKVHCETWS